MKNKLLTLSICLLISTFAFSQIAEGYYRVCNYASKRYIYIEDNKCNTPIPETLSDAAIGKILNDGVDFGSIALYSDHAKTISNPSTVLYITKQAGIAGDGGYNITGQDVSTYQMLKQYFCIKKNIQNGQYSPYMDIRNYGTQYLFDRESTLIIEKGKLDIKETTNYAATGFKPIDFRSWIFEPLNSETDNYFGIAPTIQIGDKYYAPFFTGFPFKTASKGMKVYTITKAENGFAVIQDISDGIIPAATPVIIECSSKSAGDNRLDFITDNTAAPSSNILKGAYYMNTRKSHLNLVAYNKETMRVLGVTKDGRLGFVTSGNMANIPANNSYLELSGSGISSEYTIMTESEYQEEMRKAGDNSIQNDNGPFTVYSILGTIVKECCYSTEELENGIYIIEGNKVIVNR